MLCVLGVFALVSVRSPGTSDMMAFWMPFYQQMKGLDLVEGYGHTALDYPPFTHALIHWSGGVMDAYLIDPLWGFKACVLLCTVLAAVVFRWAWRGGIPLYLLIAGAVVSGSLLGYLDVFYAPTVLLALWALQRRRLTLFSVLFTVSCFIKWQPLIFAPFCAWHALRPAGARPQDGLAWSVSRTARSAVPAVVIVLAILLAYGTPVVNAFKYALDDTFLSGDALNANWAATYLLNVWHPGTIPPLTLGQAQTIDAPMLGGWMWIPKLAFIGMYGLCLWRFHRGANTFQEFLRASMMGFLTYCMCNTGVHENHYYIASLLACVLAGVDTRATPQAFLVSFFAIMNLVVFYGFSGGGLNFNRVVGLDTTFLLALAYTALYLWWWLGWMREVDLIPRARAVGDPRDAAAGELLPERS